MKKILLILGVLTFLGGCKDKVKQKYMANVPVYTDYELFRSTGGFGAAQSIEKQGNIYFKDDYLFMVEPDKGVHFIDNTNPSSPVQKGFLSVWGATGMAIKGDFLYVNSFIDLVVYDLSAIDSPTLVDRLEDVFPTALPVSEKNYPYQTIDKSKGVVTSWELDRITVDVTSSNPSWVGCFNCDVMLESNSWSGSGGTVSSGAGIAGSISLFTIVNDHLYVMESGSLLHPFDLSNAAAPALKDPVAVSGEVETLFPYKDYIFMGTPTGMIIYDATNPAVPFFLSRFSHARGCDPVVVQDDYAYVTVRSGGACGGTINQMDVIDISTIDAPVLKASLSLKNPHGLGIDGNQLFVCDGDDGLKVFDATDPLTAVDHQLYQFKKIQATDIIPVNGIAIVIGEDGIFQYDYSDISDVKLISSLNF